MSQQPGAIKADFQAMDAAIKKKRRRCDGMIVMFGSKNFHSSLGNGVAGMMGFFMILHGTSKWGHSWHLLANQNSAETCCPLRSSGACGSYLYFSSGQRLAEVGYVGFHVPNFKKCREKKVIQPTIIDVYRTYVYTYRYKNMCIYVYIYMHQNLNIYVYMYHQDYTYIYIYI